MKRNGHSSPVKNKVEGKPHQILEKLKITAGKSTLFGHFFVKYVLVTCVHICIYLNTNEITPILHTCLTLCWSCLCSTARYLVVLFWFWVVRVKQKKNKSVKLVSREGKLFLNLNFTSFMTVFDIFLNSIHNINWVKIEDMKYFFLKLKRKCKKKGKDQGPATLYMSSDAMQKQG